MRGPMMTKKLFSNQSGFTLVEMAIVMVLLGLVIASGSQLYKQWIRFDRAVTTQENIDNAVLAITQHRDLYGEYPCPAPLTASRSTPQVGGGATYGIATDCAQTTGAYALGAGVTAAGVARTNSDNITVAHSYADMDNIGGPPLMTIPTIRIGALPFRTMNIEENESFDGYGNRIFYAVTEQLADRRWFDALGGGIEILNDQGVSAIQDPQTPGIRTPPISSSLRLGKTALEPSPAKVLKSLVWRVLRNPKTAILTSTAPSAWPLMGPPATEPPASSTTR
jgi:prepilin-type N-terminal cleavage/methylation domain-containing protein